MRRFSYKWKYTTAELNDETENCKHACIIMHFPKFNRGLMHVFCALTSAEARGAFK
jgi:hypothetical protein